MWNWIKQYWLGTLFGAVVGVLGAAVKAIWAKQKCQIERQTAVEDGLRGLLHDRINERYRECEKKGYADIHDRENLELLYRPYHALGGNSTGTDLYNRVRDLPTTP